MMLHQDVKDSTKTTIDSRMIFTALLLLTTVGALITYKTTASLAVLEKVQATGVLKPRFELIQSVSPSIWIDVFNKTFSYFSVVWIALLFGVLISGAVRVFVSPKWLTGLFGTGKLRTQFAAAAAGSPLMLCSCCVAPIFTSVYEKSSRLAPSLALMLAAPSLNPAALILTFILFGTKIGIVRLLVSALAVLVPGLLAENFVKVKPLACAVEASEDSSEKRGSLTVEFIVSCLKVALQTLPLIIIGVAISMFITEWLPVESYDSTTTGIAIIILAALIAVLLAMPTFFEIPLALMLIAAGMPTGAAVAVLIAGPATNLPSLLTIGRSTGWKVPVLVGASVWALAVAGGLLISLF
jgi:uncharacterized protein